MNVTIDRPAVIMMVKDEADIIAKCLKHWLDHGVTDFYICDNGSTDWTDKIIEELSSGRGINITLSHDNDPTFAGERIINELKNKAIEDGHRWIFPADADEFIQLPNKYSSLSDFLKTLNNNEKPFFLQMRYLNVYPGGGTLWQDPQTKVFGWFDKNMIISIGSHLVNGKQSEVNYSIYYKHYQFRTKRQLEDKIVNHGKAMTQMGLTDNRYYIWYQDYLKNPSKWIKEKWNELLNAGVDDSAPKWL